MRTTGEVEIRGGAARGGSRCDSERGKVGASLVERDVVEAAE